MTITTKATAKVAAIATGLAIATSMLSLAPIAHAQTACSVGATDLTIGSTGAAVTCLQQVLIGMGYAIPAGATGYFGMQTKAAVGQWQAAKGISPAAGYFGPISRSAWGGGTVSTGGTSSVPGCAVGAMFSATTGQPCWTASTVPGCAPGAMFSATTGQACTTSITGLTGSGRLTGISSLGDVKSDLKEGDGTTAVVGVSADATGGDVAVQRVDAEFTISSSVTSSSANLNKYVSEVSLWLGGTRLATMDPAMGDKDGRVWTLRFSGLNGVIAKGTTGNIYVKVVPVSSIGATEDGETITIDLDANSVRAIGADGISDTYLTDATISGQTFTVASLTAGTLTVTAAGDNPNASQVAVSSSTTTGVKLLSFNMKAKNSDITVTDVKAQFVTSDNNLNDVVNTVYLMKGSTVLKSKTLSTGTAGFVTFTDVNETIAKDNTQNYTIVADLKGDSAYTDGTTLIASTTTSGWDVSDADGASITPSAAAVGNTMTLTAAGFSVTRGTPTATVEGGGFSGAVDTATFSIPFTVTAGDSDIYVAGAANNASGNTAGKVNYGTTTTSTTAATAQPTATLAVGSTVTGDSAGVYYKVLSGTSRTFTLTAAVSASSTPPSVGAAGVTSGFVGMQIGSIAYGTEAGVITSYYTSNLDTFKTADVFVMKH